jgi:hypothetical protein
MRNLPLAFALVTVAAIEAAGAEGRLGVGLRTTTQHLRGPEDEADEIHMAGAGIQARFRFSRRFGVELSLEALRGELGEGTRRQAGHLALALVWHLTPDRPWDLYLLAGLGGGRDEVVHGAASGGEVAEEHEQTLAQLGVGLERRWRRLGLGVELRGVALERKDAGEARPADAVPPRSRGAQGSLTLSYYF